MFSKSRALVRWVVIALLALGLALLAWRLMRTEPPRVAPVSQAATIESLA